MRSPRPTARAVKMVSQRRLFRNAISIARFVKANT